VDGKNYLIPSTPRLERDIDVEDESVPLDRVVQILEPASGCAWLFSTLAATIHSRVP